MSKRRIEHDLFGDKNQSPINNNRKGKENERELAKALSDWLGVPVNRTPSSGGLRWADSQSIAGDIVAPAILDFPFVVETKHLQSFSVPKNGKIGTRSKFRTVMEQCLQDCVRLYSNTGIWKRPLVFVRKNRMEKRVWHLVCFDGVHGFLKEQGCEAVAYGEWDKLYVENGTKILIKGKIFLCLSLDLLTTDYQNLLEHLNKNPWITNKNTR